MKTRRIIAILSLFGVLCAGISCSDWTETEVMDQEVIRPDRQDPAGWAEYVADVTAYKRSEHLLTYACLQNAPEPSTSERDFLRSLPDSLDIVSLQRTPSSADLEDLPRMRELGTRVLCPLLPGEDAAAVGNRARKQGFDGVALQAWTAPFADLGATLAALGEVGMVVYEGDPLLADPTCFDAFDLVVVPSAMLVYQADIELLRDEALRAGIPADRLLLSAVPGGSWRDFRSTKTDALTLGLRLSLPSGLPGLALYDIGQDYYHASGVNYQVTRSFITRLALTPKN
ncbi:MAG TPA: hypothetical protein H9828_09350 [Candidatus Alistipes intestinigallinarum]|uniref:Uncharacterized protein n=1 Tax=Candidatus Alistipes intestinigallinarum TaxID=2838440 RepID=A0A9D1Z1D9_9BACT|nr:hypothetical protein [Candidatus Alistipes intestinigallinarum]